MAVMLITELPPLKDVHKNEYSAGHKDRKIHLSAITQKHLYIARLILTLETEDKYAGEFFVMVTDKSSSKKRSLLKPLGVEVNEITIRSVDDDGMVNKAIEPFTFLADETGTLFTRGRPWLRAQEAEHGYLLHFTDDDGGMDFLHLTVARELPHTPSVEMLVKH